MKYRIEISAEAQADLRDAYLWIYRDSPVSAAHWREKLLNTIQSLSELPLRCELAAESDYFQREIRQLLYGKRRGVYRILFTIEQDVIYILHIRHAARRFLGEFSEAEEPEENDTE
jgi:plasmid stabilization system protein ParE